MNRNESVNLLWFLELHAAITTCGNSLSRFRSQTLYPIELRARITWIFLLIYRNSRQSRTFFAGRATANTWL